VFGRMEDGLVWCCERYGSGKLVACVYVCKKKRGMVGGGRAGGGESRVQCGAVDTGQRAGMESENTWGS
jgi:hypothetical protein